MGANLPIGPCSRNSSPRDPKVISRGWPSSSVAINRSLLRFHSLNTSAVCVSHSSVWRVWRVRRVWRVWCVWCACVRRACVKATPHYKTISSLGPITPVALQRGDGAGDPGDEWSLTSAKLLRLQADSLLQQLLASPPGFWLRDNLFMWYSDLLFWFLPKASGKATF